MSRIKSLVIENFRSIEQVEGWVMLREGENTVR